MIFFMYSLFYLTNETYFLKRCFRPDHSVNTGTTNSHLIKSQHDPLIDSMLYVTANIYIHTTQMVQEYTINKFYLIHLARCKSTSL